jgi:hypothetical protein
MLQVGDNPALCHCRVCGSVAVPPYPGYYRDAVCSRPCFDEWQWRDTLKILGKPYRPRAVAPTNVDTNSQT